MALSVQEILDYDFGSPLWALNPSLAAPIRSDMSWRRASTDDQGREWNPASSQFEVVSPDEPRIYGEDQALIIDKSTTNEVPYSSDFSQWSSAGISAQSSVSSVIAGKSARSVDGNGVSAHNRLTEACGTFSGNREVFWAIIERNTADETGIGIRDASAGSLLEEVVYDWGNEALSADGTSGLFIDTNKLLDDGPNGGEVRIIEGTVPAESQTAGNNRAFWFFPDHLANGNGTIIHHAQIEQRAYSNVVPVVSSGTPKTIGKDSGTIFSGGQPNWFNDEGLTLFVELTPHMAYVPNTQLILQGGGSFERFFYINSSTRPFEVGALAPDPNGNNNNIIDNALPAYQRSKVAISYLPDDMNITVNGDPNLSQNFFTEGSLLNVSELNIHASYGVTVTIHDMRFLPGYLSLDEQQVLTA